MASLLDKAAATDQQTVWIDMEGSDYTEATIALYERLKQTYPNVGICLQAYLKRTYSDVERLLPLSPRIRLVKGAYAEPAADRLPVAQGGRRQLLGAVRVDARRGQGRPRPVPGPGHARRPI